MDFFNVLRAGCTFGRSDGTVAPARSKPQEATDSKPPPRSHPELEAERRGKSANVRPLDFFGSEKQPEEGQAAGRQQASGSGGTKRKRKRGEDGHDEETDEAAATPEDRKAAAAKQAVAAKRASQQEEEEVAAFRRRNKIHTNVGAPRPIESFDQMPARGVPNWLVRNLEGLGFTRPTPVQMQCFPAVLAGGHVLASAPTGSGKTIAFLGPLLVLLGKPGKEFARALIIDPSRELAQQTLDEFEKLTAGKNWTGCLLHRLTGEKAQKIKKLDVAVVTPLSLATMLREKHVTLNATRHVVLDEADKLLDLGFAPQVDEILNYCPKGEKGDLMQTLMFSATLPPAVLELAKSILHDPLHITIGATNAAAPDIDQRLTFITHEDGKLFSFRQMLREGKVKPPTLIFVQSKERAKELFGELVFDGIFVDAIHADRTKKQRENTVKAFRLGKIWMLICTDLMARGVDFKGVETVVNYDFPQSATTYIHRIGRTGRAGRKGTAITMFTIQDFESLRSIVGVMRQSGCEVPEWMLRLKLKNKKQRRFAELRPPKRKRISTVSGWDLSRKHKRQQTAASIKGKMGSSQEDNGSKSDDRQQMARSRKKKGGENGNRKETPLEVTKKGTKRAKRTQG